MNIKNKNNELKGIGGWLILVAISIIVTIIVYLKTIFDSINHVILSGILERLSSLGSPDYLLGFASAYYFELSGNILTLLLYCYLGYLFFSQHYKFVRYFIGVRIFMAIFGVIDYIFVRIVYADGMHADPESIKAMISTIIHAAIWIPYLLLSVRVKNTFVRGKNSSAPVTTGIVN